MAIALVIVIIIFSVTTNGTILLSQNINNLLSQNAYVFVLGTGMLLCILTGGNIDLSVGSVVAFVGGIGAVLMQRGTNAFVAAIVMIIAGGLVGAWQAFWVAYVNVPPFIATLAGMYAFRGLANVVLQGYAVSISNKTFLNVFGGGADCYVPDFFGGSGLNITCMAFGIIAVLVYLFIQIRGRVSAVRKGYSVKSAGGFYAQSVIISVVILFLSYKLAGYKGIPSSLLWIVGVILLYFFITTRTKIGRYLYAVGGNEKATQLSGINTKRVYFFAYTNMGILTGLASILTVARAASAQPTYGNMYEMDAIGACFIGGASAYGGTGSVFGTIIGALLLGVINQGMSIMGVDANYQKVVKGLVLLAAVIFDVLSKREKK
ncbi:MAG: sugar ABC transporter permease [Pseudobutyrivibrio sp.]|nr:sugar ABC transporter permease [Pseudobutyrivibrio sp.]